MSSVMITCPKTGRPVSTAIDIEPTVFRKLARLSARMRCPACGQDHVFMTSSAWLAGEPRLVGVRRSSATEAA